MELLALREHWGKWAILACREAKDKLENPELPV
jgi:hypothetical protein